MQQVKIREKGQVTIPAELLQEWSHKNHVFINDFVDATLVNGVLMLIPKQRNANKRSMMSYAGVAKGVRVTRPSKSIQTLKRSEIHGQDKGALHPHTGATRLRGLPYIRIFFGA